MPKTPTIVSSAHHHTISRMSPTLSSTGPSPAGNSPAAPANMPNHNRSENSQVTTATGHSPEVVTQEWLLRHRLKRVEETWASVLEEECGPKLVALLTRLRQLCAPDGQANAADDAPVLQLIAELELSDAIKMARAFALYFQLINIVEQHYEQRGQQQQYRAASEDAAIASAETLEGSNGQNAETSASQAATQAPNNGFTGQSAITESLQSTDSGAENMRDVGTFYWLFPTLKRLNVPPKMIQRLLDQLDVRLVFTAHPTE
ncbi:MAG: phosphoenolpyruvate carboxylase, partial [Cyanobacteria bacterium P01_D01_bin.36]